VPGMLPLMQTEAVETNIALWPTWFCPQSTDKDILLYSTRLMPKNEEGKRKAQNDMK
jgi:hypothetical protein